MTPLSSTAQCNGSFAAVIFRHLKHNEGRVPPQLQRDPLDGGAAQAVQLLPNLGGASEREDGHLMGNIFYGRLNIFDKIFLPSHLGAGAQ